jgi:hypothetical protein
MRSQHLKAIAILAVGMMLLFWVGRGATAKAQDWDRDGRTLVGTWVVTVTQQACPGGPGIAPPFKSLLTFNAGGTMTETTDNPMFFLPCAVRAMACGVTRDDIPTARIRWPL